MKPYSNTHKTLEALKADVFKIGQIERCPCTEHELNKLIEGYHDAGFAADLKSAIADLKEVLASL